MLTKGGYITSEEKIDECQNVHDNIRNEKIANKV